MSKSVSGMGSFPSKRYKRSIRNNELKITVSMSDDIDYLHIFCVKKSWDFIKSGEESDQITRQLLRYLASFQCSKRDLD